LVLAIWLGRKMRNNQAESYAPEEQEQTNDSSDSGSLDIRKHEQKQEAIITSWSKKDLEFLLEENAWEEPAEEPIEGRDVEEEKETDEAPVEEEGPVEETPQQEEIPEQNETPEQEESPEQEQIQTPSNNPGNNQPSDTGGTNNSGNQNSETSEGAAESSDNDTPNNSSNRPSRD